jgi:hypothetical protein
MIPGVRGYSPQFKRKYDVLDEITRIIGIEKTQSKNNSKERSCTERTIRFQRGDEFRLTENLIKILAQMKQDGVGSRNQFSAWLAGDPEWKKV